MTTAKQLAAYAESLCGDDGGRYRARFGLPGNSPWSAAFASYCLSKFPETSGIVDSPKCSDFTKMSTSSDIDWIPGPQYGSSTRPKEGDIVLINWSSKQDGKVNRISIVRRYNREDNTIDVVMGDSGSDCGSSTVAMRTYNADLSCIKGYMRIKSLN